MADLHFELVTPEKLVRSEDVFMVVVPGTEGEFGVLAGHAPFMTTVRDGEIRVHSSMTTVTARIKVEGGFAEVNEKGLTVLAEHAELLG
jgi:F-type H+-transporting ATPase subunit epsilon